MDDMSLHPGDTNFGRLGFASSAEYPKAPATAISGDGIGMKIGNAAVRPIAAPGQLSAREEYAAGEKILPADRR